MADERFVQKAADWFSKDSGGRIYALWAGLALLLVASNFYPSGHVVLRPLKIFIRFVNMIGALWLLYFATRYEERALRYMVLTLVPYSFVWYWLARVRTGEVSPNLELRDRQKKEPVIRAFILFTVAFAGYLVSFGEIPSDPLELGISAFIVLDLALMFSFVFYCLYLFVRYEKRPAPHYFLILLIFLPATLWYYYVRIRGRNFRRPVI